MGDILQLFLVAFYLTSMTILNNAILKERNVTGPSAASGLPAAQAGTAGTQRSS
jgi:hypothetical protein